MNDTEQKIREMIIALYHIPGIGWHNIDRAVNADMWSNESWDVGHFEGIGFRKDRAEKAAALLVGKRHSPDWLSSGATEQSGTAIITCYDKNYPSILKEIAQPPWVLYAKGRLELLERPAVALVGTRVPTAYGRHTAAAMARELSQDGFAVVSGLAKGVDAIAHLAALEEAGGTIAVMPTPIDTCYPSENLSLFRAIAQKGLLLSETPLGTTLHRGQFHQRNRIIAGLSRATIVVEGASQSGSLITAKYAFQMDRELFAVPGPISSPKSEGPNALIRDGMAKLISSSKQVAKELEWLGDAFLRKPETRTEESLSAASGDSEEELKLIALLQDQQLTIDELHETSGIPFGHLNALLLNLCIKRKIGLQSGSIYCVL